MKYSAAWADLKYEARLREPLFAVSGAPLKFAEALCAALRPLCSIAARDISIVTRSEIDVRVKVNLLGGNANLEIAPDFLSVNFRNPQAADGDLEVIKKLVAELLSFVNVQAHRPFLEDEAVTFRGFLSLKEEPKNGIEFLRSVCAQSNLYSPSRIAAGSRLSPGLRFDIECASQKWTFNFELSRAMRNTSELLVLATTQFGAKSKLSDTFAKFALIDRLMVESLKRANLEPEPRTPSSLAKAPA